MSNDGQNNAGVPPPGQHHRRRDSITPGIHPATSFLNRRNSLAIGIPPQILTGPLMIGESPHHRRGFSVSASFGLATSPNNNSAFDFHRSSTSTSGDSAIEDDDGNPPPPLTPFSRHASMQVRGFGGSICGSPNSGNDPVSFHPLSSSYNGPVVGSGNRARRTALVDGGSRPSARRHSSSVAAGAGGDLQTRRDSTLMGTSGFLNFDGPPDSGPPPPSTAGGTARRGRYSNCGVGSIELFSIKACSNAFANNKDQGTDDWGAHLRARAQSFVNGTRPSFGTSPPQDAPAPAPAPVRPPPASKEAALTRPPVQPLPPKTASRSKPDSYQERILKGDFYMD